MSRYRRLVAAALGASLLLLLTPSVAAARAPATDPVVTVQVKSVNGSGCPAGSSVTTNVPDQTAFTISFSQFRVEGGMNKTCVVTVNVAVPAGWTYAVYEVDNRGFGVLDARASGRIVMDSWFTGYKWTLNADQTFTGPYDGYWQTTSTADSAIFAPCNASFNLTIADTLRVKGPSTSSMELFAKDLRVSTIFYLKWMRC